MLSSFNGYDESKVFLRFSEISEYPGSKDCVYLEKYLVNIEVNIIIDKKNLFFPTFFLFKGNIYYIYYNIYNILKLYLYLY